MGANIWLDWDSKERAEGFIPFSHYEHSTRNLCPKREEKGAEDGEGWGGGGGEGKKLNPGEELKV